MTRNRIVAALSAALLTAGVTGCVDFTGPGLSTNPNQSSQATANQLFAAIQGLQQPLLTGDINRYVAVWDQQMMGVNRQWSSYARYNLVDENLLFWDGWYTGAGLVDLRNVEATAVANNDKIYLGIAQVYEALIMSYATDAWGNIPYSEAVNPAKPTPILDSQASVYAALQTLLDNAIVNLASGIGTGPGGVDLVYGGSTAKWTAMAHTLKARLYLHTAKIAGAAAYASALTQAQLGIASAAGDYSTYQSGTVGEENQWFQFKRNRGTDISASATLVNMMAARSDPRLANYFAPNGAAVIKGANPGDEDDGTFSWLSTTRAAAGYHQPVITYAENQHILAEAQQRGGSDVNALASLNAYNAAAGLPAAPVLAGSALLQEILTSKYIALFQNFEAWNDYKRTCWPNLIVNPTAAAGLKIPARFYYPASERQTNPNIPAPAAQAKRNPMDPALATTIGGAACLGQ